MFKEASFGEELDYLHFKDFSQIWMWIILEATIDTTTT